MPNREDQSYDYHYDSDDPYVYEGTNILINKFGLTNPIELSRIERAITGAAIASLEITPVVGKYDLKHLQAIHKALFEEIYEWAGQIRRRGFISKGNSLFCAAEYIEPYSTDLFEKLKGEDYLRDLDHEAFADRVAFYIAEINALHPFREGNGRTQRVFIDQLSRQAGWKLNLTAFDPEELLNAYIVSMADYEPLADLLKGTIQPCEQD